MPDHFAIPVQLHAGVHGDLVLTGQRLQLVEGEGPGRLHESDDVQAEVAEIVPPKSDPLR
jgi:hypothetical protein